LGSKKASTSEKSLYTIGGQSGIAMSIKRKPRVPRWKRGGRDMALKGKAQNERKKKGTLRLSSKAKRSGGLLR